MNLLIYQSSILQSINPQIPTTPTHHMKDEIWHAFLVLHPRASVHILVNNRL
jgi:hypothetical protein